jgi:hypothetical protein
VDSTQIPTGEMAACAGTPFDFTSSADNGTLLGERIPLIDGGGSPGIDHTFIVDEKESASGLLSRSQERQERQQEAAGQTHEPQVI